MDSVTRLLRLLSLLERRQDWNGEQLATEIGVTTRTVRRDIARLREIGFPVATTNGPGGGYNLVAGTNVPPVMFEPDETVATMLALQLTALERADGDLASEGSIPAAANSAMDKLRRVMPTRLRRISDSLLTHTSSIDLGQLVTENRTDPPAAQLVLLTAACRSRTRVTCRNGDADATVRTLEPLHLVHTMGHWYLHAYCLSSGAWTTLRVDELDDIDDTSEPSTHRPPDDVREQVVDNVKRGIRRVNGSVRVLAPIETVRPWIAPAWAIVTADSDESCVVDAGADTYDGMARWLSLLDAEIVVLRPVELAEAFGRLAARARRASRSAMSEIRQ